MNLVEIFIKMIIDHEIQYISVFCDSYPCFTNIYVLLKYFNEIFDKEKNQVKNFEYKKLMVHSMNLLRKVMPNIRLI